MKLIALLTSVLAISWSVSAGPGVFLNAPVFVETGPDLTVRIESGPIDPGLPFDVRVSVGNRSLEGATGVEATIDVPRALGVASLPDSCVELGPTTVRCAIGSVAASTSEFSLDAPGRVVAFVAPEDTSGSILEGSVTVRGDQPDHDESTNTARFETRMFHTGWVTSTADSGPGSLRSVIEELNSACRGGEACKIAFRIAPSGDGSWETIRLISPLPAITVPTISIDGTTQPRFFGERNALGPEIELLGSTMEPRGNGLVIASACDAEVSGLVINGFGESGILVRSGDRCPLQRVAPSVIRDCYIGTDPTGMAAVPNGRGIVFALDGSEPGAWQVVQNLISGNRRSGIFSLNGARNISRNVIGLNRDLSGGLGNGASGVYIGPDSRATGIENNYIGFNGHFGIGVDRDARDVSMEANSIQANLQGGIDWGLDGVGGTTFPELPVITSAIFDPVSETTIVEGMYPVRYPVDPVLDSLRISLYANDAPDASGYGEGQYYLGLAIADPGDGGFRFEYPGDLRGKWVSATATFRNTYALSKPERNPSGDDGWSATTTGEFGFCVEVH